MSYYSELSGPGLVRAPVNRTAQFDITGEGLELSDIQAKISGPDNREYPIRIIPRSSGKYTAEYEIEQVGEHHLTVWIAGRKVDGSPLSVAGYATEKVRLEPLGGGVPKQPVQFYVDAVEAGKGQLEISVNQGKVPNNVQMQGAGRCLVTFIPQHAGTYVIDVTFNGEQVHGCPIKVEILPKQVGQQIHANLTPTAVSTAISAGGTSLISGAFRETARSPLSARSPTSPTLLQHARQRSEETMLRSPQLLRESRKADKPWQSSYAPSSSRNAFSQSPHRDWSASTVYDRVYNSNSDVERTLSPSDPSRNRNIRETTTVIHRTPSPTGLRTQEFAERIARSPSPTGYEREFVEKRTTYRSPSPARTSSVAHSHISEVPLSPIQGMDTPFDHHERVKKVERMDPLADEEEREQRRNQLERDSKNTLGYTVAQYGDGEKRYFGDTLEKKDRPPSAGYYSSVQQRSTSPEYSTVYERYDRKSEKPDLPPRVEGHVSASYKGYEPVYSEVTTTRTTTTTEYENIDKKPNVPKKRATTPEGHVEPVNDNEEKDRQAFLRTQSEKVFEPVDAPLRRSDEKESIYDLPPQERLHKYPEEPTIALGEKANTSAIAAYTKGRQDDIDEVSRNASFPSAPTINYNERSDEVSNYNRTKEDHYGVVGEYPTAPKIAYSDSKEAVIREHYAQAKEDPYATVGECPPAPEISLRSDKLNETKNEYRRTTDSDQQDGKAGPPPPVIEISKAEQARRTEEYLRVKSEDDKILAKHGFTRKPEPSIEIQEPVTEQIRDDVVETAIAPEVPLRPVEELPHSPAPSSRSTPATTPKLSAKFRKDGKEGKPFDFGKSKFVCKHDVIKRGKEVEVKLEGIKLGKEDQLRVVVLPPANKAIPGANGGPPTEVDTKVKKSSSKYEISFKPTEVGTHKVFAYVNDMQHPLSPFAVRVYDASEIIVGEIPNQSNLNDTVEFTVDAGRAGFGNLEMAIKDADGVIIPSHVAQLESGSAKFLVTFTPATKGPHTVNITFNKEVLKNSPFEVNIVDAPLPAPVVLEPASGASAVASPSLSKKELKEQEKEKKREEKERAKREKEERATLKKEKKSKSHRFPAKTTVSKIPSLSRVGQPSSLVVEVSGHDQLEIRVLDSKKSEIGTDIVEIEPGHMQINFTPAQVGDHEIDVRYGGVPVTGSPFTCRAYDPAKIKVGAIPKGLLDKPVYFTVDASEAGVGNLEVAVCEGRVPSMAHALGHHKYDISFVPKEDVDHTITVRFNNEPVPGSPFLCQLVATAQATATGAGLERIPVDEETEIQILTDEIDSAPEARVRDPQGNDLPVNVTRSRENETLHIATYVPKCVGNHLIDIFLQGEPIAGSPFTAKAYDARKTVLVPPANAVVGKPATFVIDAARSGAGNMEIIVSVDNRNVPNFVQAEGQARFKVSFTPQDAKDHTISVKFNGISVPGSPLICSVSSAGSVPAAVVLPAAAVIGAETAVAARERIKHTPQHSSEQIKQTTTTVLQKTPEIRETVEKTGLARELNSAQIGQKKGFTIDNINKSSDCNVIITDPKGGPLPVRCYKQQDDSYWVEFTPEHLGTHTIEVTFGDVPVPGSPFKTEVIDPKNVEIRGLSDQVLLRHATTINVDRRNAGNGELQVEITDPTGSPLRTEMLKSPGGEDRITFLPNQTGPHKINVKVAGFQIPGYPQTILVSEQEKPAVYGAAVDQSIKIGEPASLIFDPKKTNGGLKIHATGPDGQKVHHNVMRRPNGTSEVVFYPEETGTYNVSIDFNNRPITGSPFTVNVVDPTKVIVNDLDMDRDGTLLLRLGHSNSFDVDATAAGPGKLRAEVRDADSSLIGNGPVVEDMGQGKYRVRFNPDQPGKYSIYLYWNELPVESAFPVRARSSAEDLPTTSRAVREPIPPPVTTTYHTREKSSGSNADDEISRIMVRGDGLHRAVLKEHNEFIIDGSDINKEGRITATLLGSKADIPVRIQQLGHNVYKATYTPLTGGTYELHILWNGKHVKGSPFAVSADTSAHLADLIDVDASTLKIGIINENIKTLIDTRRAGSGQLSALCMGPNKPAYCELYDHRDGTYALCVRPAEIGKHTLVIKYDDEHVKGSPFVVHVSLPPDPSKVRVYGPGVEHGILSLFKSNFVVETRGAGAGQLTVRVRGPKGAFNVEMQREKKNERTIHCKYEPKEPGDYQVEVKWHGEHVPGSPFLVMIVDTEKELSRYLRGEAPSPTPATPFIPPGWVAPPQMYPMQPGQQRFLPPPGHFGPMGVPSPYGSVPPPTKHKGRNH
ncbi:Filamin-A [Caenorhabditis elegans]|nr:Filamin-A [Caenorhabditis elegans]CTQ87041.1 Filamin-A [Caenorhabditis elegans]|eukprot:NP_001300330.1 FiLamiN (actin binding protein) homolog [Caenorhabditis elegans]